MEKYQVFVLFLLLLLSCGKKETALTNENIKEVLALYGKENPENEVVIETKFGTMRIRLYEDTPLHRANFIKLIKEGHYDNAEFYRIVNEFMIQGGDLSKKLKYRVPAEFNPKYIHKRGAVSMAREDEDNPQMESSAAEFFIVHGTGYSKEDLDAEALSLGLTLTPEQKQIYLSSGGYMTLDQKYTTFGEVIEGLDVIEKIARERVFNGDKPVKKIPLKINVVAPK